MRIKFKPNKQTSPEKKILKKIERSLSIVKREMKRVEEKLKQEDLPPPIKQKLTERLASLKEDRQFLSREIFISKRNRPRKEWMIRYR